MRCLVDAAASLPLVPYRRLADGRERYDGPLSELLAAPAPAVTQSSLVGSMMGSLQLHGDAFVGKYRDGNSGCSTRRG